MGALNGVRVVDFGQYIAGPLAAVMLADQGADVIHVDPPGGPRWQDPSEAFFNRSKRRIVLDLKQPEDHATAVRLIERADVLIENFRPGVMERLGLGADAMRERNPQLIYTSIPGFASDDPRRDVPAWEGVVSAATDIYHPASELYAGPQLVGEDATRPAYTPIPLASNFGGFHAATASVMALIARERSGQGQRIEVPLFDAVYELYGVHGISVDGVYPKQSGSPYGGGKYQCGDGRWVQFSTSNAHFLHYFAKGAGIEDWASEGLLDVDRLEREPELRQELRARFRELFLTRPAAEWEAVSNAAGCPMSMVRSAAEWMENEHARSSEAIVPVEDPELGPSWMPGLHIHMAESPGEIRPRRAPDADRDEILRELDSIPPRAALPAREPDLRTPLEGWRVLDLTQVVAGPCAGRIMGEYGAEVIKINSPFARDVPAEFSTSGHDADPGNQQHEHLNRGKLTIRLDVRSPEGRDAFWKLVEQADVVMQNFPMGTADRYGIGYDTARDHKPDLIYFSLSAYGYGGPWGAWRGYEGNAQAATGLMERFGGDGPPQSQPFLLDDYGTGVRGAFGMALALYHRQQTGQGQHIRTALVETASYHAARHLVTYAGKQWDEPRGPTALGEGPLQRLYRASDEWFFLGAADHQRAALAAVEGLEGIDGLEGAALEQALEERFAGEPLATWLERLPAAGVGVSSLQRMRDLMVDPWAEAHNLVVTQEIEGLGHVRMPGAAPRLSGTPIRIGDPVNPPGADAPFVLGRVGLGDAVDRLVAAGVLKVPAATVA